MSEKFASCCLSLRSVVVCFWLSVLVAAGQLITTACHARTLQVGVKGEVLTFDPHSYLDTLTQSLITAVYEPLVRFGRSVQIEPALAESYTQIDAFTWRFVLREEVRFHDGTPVTADDVVFSVARAKRGPIRVLFSAIKHAKKINERTVVLETLQPNPVLLRELTLLYIMPAGSSTIVGSIQPEDTRAGRHPYAARSANGTGAYVLKSFEPGLVRLVRNDDWWMGRPAFDEIDVTTVHNDATRVAAFIQGRFDMIDPVPLQDIPRIRTSTALEVVQIETSRTIFLGFDQRSDELPTSNVKGRNPFKDVRVKRAFAHAIDTEAIRDRNMRGAATPAASLFGPAVEGYDHDLDQRLPLDIGLARSLLEEAGYADGFSVQLDCPNDRYINDEAVCQAVAVMLARIGIRVEILAQPSNRHFTLLQAGRSSFNMVGWISPTYDALGTLNALVVSRNGDAGLLNFGGYSNSRVDEVTQAARTEVDRMRRNALVAEAARIHRDEVGHLVLYRQWLAWGIRKGLHTVPLPDTLYRLEWMSWR